MALGSGFGTGAFGEDPYGETNFARKILLENLPQVYLDEDLENDKIFRRFIKSLFPHTNEFRDLLDRFPLIRDPERIPPDSIDFVAILQNNFQELQVVKETLPFVVPGNQVTIIGENPAETITVTVVQVDNALSRIKIGSPFPFATSVRSVRVRDLKFPFLVTNASDFIVAVPEVFPKIRIGDYIQIGDTRHSVIAVTPDLFKFSVFPSPVVPSGIERQTLTRLSRLVLLTLLAKDIGLTDDPTKLEIIRRGIVLHAVEFFKLKGTRKGYQIRGALEGLLVDVSNVQETPCVSTTCEFVPIAIGRIITVDGLSITDGQIVTINDGITPAKTFEFDKDGVTVAPNVPVPITNAMTAADVAFALGTAINAQSPFFVKADFEIDSNIIELRNDDAGLAGAVAITDTVTSPGFVVEGMLPYHGVACEEEKKSDEPLLYMSEFDVVPTDTISVDSPSKFKYFDLGTPSTGSITTVAGALISDGETITLDDGENPPVTFEFDKNNLINPSNVPIEINDLMTDVDVAVAVEDAINSVPERLRITATNPFATNTVTLRNDTSGDSARNVPIQDTVVDAGFSVAGMSGGSSIMDEITVPVRYQDTSISFEVIGVQFRYNPGPAVNQITLVTTADLLVGDLVEFGMQQRVVTAVPGISPMPEFPGMRNPGTVITFDAPLIGLVANDKATRVSRQPDISADGDFLTIAGFDYKVVQFSPALFVGRTDFSLRDLSLVGQILVATRIRRRAVTRRQAFKFCRLPVLKLRAETVPDSLFFGGFDGFSKFVNAINEVKPLHVRFDDIRFVQVSVIKIPIPGVEVKSLISTESFVAMDNYYDVMMSDETSPTDATKVVTVETP